MAPRPRDEDAYHEINEFANRQPKRVTPPRQAHTNAVRHSPHSFVTEYTPPYPTTQPPSHPPGRNGKRRGTGNFRFSKISPAPLDFQSTVTFQLPKHEVK
ncbi:hypothetical protein OESDEN_18332 [Oesophagostomum dentatum]|uniref:Uncharacterized protein n=1 Tax=Oesophagostomum dentatum TaxID=61180 RepID=A0A0B1SEL2_OESDE|nr:hypothetical protein OESDEN_18332 [Oesophagostomum dentatum]